MHSVGSNAADEPLYCGTLVHFLAIMVFYICCGHVCPQTHHAFTVYIEREPSTFDETNLQNLNILQPSLVVTALLEETTSHRQSNNFYDP